MVLSMDMEKILEQVPQLADILLCVVHGPFIEVPQVPDVLQVLPFDIGFQNRELVQEVLQLLVPQVVINMCAAPCVFSGRRSSQLAEIVMAFAACRFACLWTIRTDRFHGHSS